MAITVQNMPVHIKEKFLVRNVDLNQLIAVEYADMAKDGGYADVWVSFDKESFYIMTGFEKIVQKKGAKRLKVEYDLLDFTCIPITDIKKLSTERFISTARLLSVDDEKSDFAREIIPFSLGVCPKIDKFCTKFNNFKEGKEIKESAAEKDEELFCPKCGLRYPDESRKICPKCMDKSSIIKRLLSFFKYYYKYVIIMLCVMLSSTVFNVVSPYVGTRLLYDEVLTPGGSLFAEIGLILALIIGVRIIGLMLNMASGWLASHIVPKVVYDIKVRIFTAMQKLSVSFYSSKQTGSIMSRVVRDATNIYWFFVDGAPFLIVNIVTFIGVVVIMMIMNWQLALIVVTIIPIIIALFRFLWKMFDKLYHAMWIHNSNMTSHISDSMSGQRVIKAFAKENEETTRFGAFSGRVRDAERKTANAERTAFPLIGMLTVIANLVVLAVGSIMIVTGSYDMTLGKLMTFTAYMNMLYGPLDFLSWVSSWWARCVDSAQRIFEVIDAVPDVKESDNPISLPNLRGDIEIKDIMFEYEPGRPIIKNMSMNVKAGQMIGIVGKTGAGKSTIVNLIARLYDVNEGYIKIDDVNVKDIAFKDLRKDIGIVSQEIYLFIGTIADNIRYAKPNASLEEVISAAKAASAHDFIMKLPDAYETKIGASGQDLSGGEKQRLSIARTIIQNPKILILDEATASMDTETERKIQDSLTELKGGRTTIAIAHRLSTLRDADVLAVIDNGDMVEYGTHDELIKKKGTYYTLYMLQFEALKHIGIAE